VPDESPSSALTEAQRSLALARFQLVRPFLEEEVPLVRLADENGLKPPERVWSLVRFSSTDGDK
jgi:hypothetical protein